MTSAIRAQLARLGEVRQLAIAFPFPAALALGEHLDSVDVHLARLDARRLTAASPGRAGLAKTAAGVSNASVRIDQVSDGQPVARNLDLTKNGPRLRLDVLLDAANITPMLDQALGHTLGLQSGIDMRLSVEHDDPLLTISGSPSWAAACGSGSSPRAGHFLARSS